MSLTLIIVLHKSKLTNMDDRDTPRTQLDRSWGIISFCWSYHIFRSVVLTVTAKLITLV